MIFDPEDEKNKKIIEHCEQYKILLVSDSKGTRASLKAFARQIGFKNDNILVAASFSEASEFYKEQRPTFLISDFHLGKQTATSLFEALKLEVSNPLERCMVLIDHKGMSLAPTRFHELGMDLLLKHPLTVDKITDGFLEIIDQKINPTRDQKNLAEVENLFFKEKYDECEKLADVLVSAKVNVGEAFYYKALVAQKNKSVENYIENLRLSVENNPPFYLSLNKLFDYYSVKEQYENAYVYMDKLLTHYPSNPNRLAEITKVFLANGHYDAIVKYCDNFLHWNEFDHQQIKVKEDQIAEDVIKNVAVCLFAAAKVAVKSGNVSRGTEILEKVAEEGKNNSQIMKKVITQLTDLSEWKVAEKVLRKIKPDDFDMDMEIIKFKIDDQTLPANESLQLGVSLLGEGVKELGVYEIIIKRSIEVGRRKEVVNDYIDDAIHLFPDEASRFSKYR